MIKASARVVKGEPVTRTITVEEPGEDRLEISLNRVEAAVLYELIGHYRPGTGERNPLFALQDAIRETEFTVNFMAYPSVAHHGRHVDTTADGWGMVDATDNQKSVANAERANWEARNV